MFWSDQKNICYKIRFSKKLVPSNKWRKDCNVIDTFLPWHIRFQLRNDLHLWNSSGPGRKHTIAADLKRGISEFLVFRNSCNLVSTLLFYCIQDESSHKSKLWQPNQRYAEPNSFSFWLYLIFSTLNIGNKLFNMWCEPQSALILS